MAVGEVDGVAVGHEVFVGAVTLYGKACVQYVVNGRSVVAFVVGSQCGTIVVGRIGGGCSSISQVALHVGQCGRCSGAASRILHAGNHVTGIYLGTCTVRLGVEVAVGVFVHLRTVGFGVHHRGLGILHYGLGIQSVGVALVTLAVQILFHSQSVTGFQRQGAARFGNSGSRSTYYVAAGINVEAAVVDGVGNVAGSGQFTCISSSRRSHFAVGYRQRSGGYGLSSKICHSFQLRNVYRISIFRTGSHINDLAGITLRTNRYRTRCAFYRRPNVTLISTRSRC